jgi:hypothetical protein
MAVFGAGFEINHSPKTGPIGGGWRAGCWGAVLGDRFFFFPSKLRYPTKPKRGFIRMNLREGTRPLRAAILESDGINTEDR